MTECVFVIAVALLGQGVPCPYAAVGEAIRQNNITKLRHTQHNSVKTTTENFGLNDLFFTRVEVCARTYKI
jgi:hypothetical protein